MMSTDQNVMLHDIYRALKDAISQASAESVEGAFIDWMNDRLVEDNLVSLRKDFTVTDYHHVARLAFLTEIAPALNEQDDNLLKDGLTRVAGRTITLVETEPAPFRHDALSLLGLALGARRIGGETKGKVLTWMRSFIAPSEQTSPGWKRVFYSAALGLLDNTTNPKITEDLTAYSDLKLAFSAKKISVFDNIDLTLAYQLIYRNTISQDVDPTIAACRLSALYELSKQGPAISLSKPSVDQLLSLLERLPSGLKRWPWEEKRKTKTSTVQQWDIQNEYHVQSLVYFILAPIFPDIEDEFYFEPVAQLNPRADIGIPSLSTIIEIKFLRHDGSFGKMIEEIAADASLYFKKNSVFSKKYSQLIVLLWDNSSRTQNHHEFKKGVSSMNNVVGAITISRPGNMEVKTNASK